MDKHSFVITGRNAAVIANDDTDFRYRAKLDVLPVGTAVTARTVEWLETQFLVQDGTVEFMIGGGTAIAFAGDFVRVLPGVVHAWRNAGDDTARILIRTVSPGPARRAGRLTIDFAA